MAAEGLAGALRPHRSHFLQRTGISLGFTARRALVPFRGHSLVTLAAASKVVVVESPSKANVIQKYLGDGYKVFASYGHVCDLPPKPGSVLPDKDFEMAWEMSEKSKPHMKAIGKALVEADELILATDPDREGEAISWHVQEALREAAAQQGILVQRVTFNEVTKKAVLEAMSAPRDVSLELVNAYLARRALDYLVGFTISPLLWRKLPGSKSAGRVQSVALRLVCEREVAVESFDPEEYWSVEAMLRAPDGSTFAARLTHLDGEKLGKFALRTEAEAAAAAARVRAADLVVSSVTAKEASRKPSPPYITSTLQQDANSKLGMGATATMSYAQSLYVGTDGEDGEGLITYMRTDGVNLSATAVDDIRAMVAREFGDNFVPGEAPRYKSRSKNAQEAHEAIRPTDPSRLPADLPESMDYGQRRLYGLIWRRAVASQMEPARFERTAVDIAGEGGAVVLRANGTVPLFAGHLAVQTWEKAIVARPADLQEGVDVAEVEEGGEEEGEGEEEEGEGEGGAAPGGAARRDRSSQPLPAGLAEGLALSPGGGGANQVDAAQHFTAPPPRYTEGTLVKALEEKSIGRPSTYASILRVLQDREYLRKEGSKLIPESRGRVVTAFLERFFDRYVDYSFTAQMEEKLDEISGGRLDWQGVLREFWEQFDGRVEGVREVRITEVIDALDEALGPHFFPSEEGKGDPRVCPRCRTDDLEGRLGLKLSKRGGFIACSNYPTCDYSLPLDAFVTGDPAMLEGPRLLGADPDTGMDVFLRVGPFGPYVALGVADPELKTKPKSASVPKGVAVSDVDLSTALKLLELPKDLGEDPEAGLPIVVSSGRFGPYVKMGPISASLPKEFHEDPASIDLPRASQLIHAKREKMVARAALGPDAKPRGGRRAPKPPAKPTPPKSAYVLFSAAKRPGLLKENPEMSLGERSKALSAMWAAVGENEKTAFEAEAAARKERYIKELALYCSIVGTEVEVPAPAPDGKPRKDPNAPKGPRTAYICFTVEERPRVVEDLPGEKFGVVAKALSARWAGLSPEKKERYTRMAADDRGRYEREMADYTPPAGAAGAGAGVEAEAGAKAGGTKTVVAKSKKSKAADGVKKPLQAYMLFCRAARPEVRAEHPGASFGEEAKILGAKWAGLDDEARGPYRALAEEDKQRYEREVAAAAAAAGAGAGAGGEVAAPQQAMPA